MRRILLAAVLAATPLAMVAVPAAAQAQAPAEMRAKAERLAAILNPVDMAVEAAAKGGDTYFVPTMKRDPNMAALESKHPGIVEAMYKALRPTMLEIERVNALETQRKFVDLYMAELTETDLDNLIAFYGGPLGQKLIEGMFNPATVGTILNDGLDNGFAEVESDTISKTRASNALGVAMALGEEAEVAATAFLETPSGKKVLALSPKVQAIAYEVMNSKHPELEARMQADMQATMKAFGAEGAE